MEIFQSLPDPMVRIFTLLLALFPLVMIHEFGHFLLAKLNGIRVEEFGIGFPPRLVRLFQAGGTEYSINWLPIGGFVRLAGEDDPTVPDAFASKSKRARSAVLLAGPAANFLLAALIFIVVAVPEEVPAVRGVTVAGLATVAGTDASPAKAAGLQPYDIIVAVDGTPISSTESDLQKRAEATLLSLQRSVDAHTGQNMNLTVLRGLSAFPVAAGLAGVETQALDLAGVDGQSVTAAPANSSLKVGDVLVSADNVHGLNGGQVALRGLTKLNLVVTPIRDTTDGKGRMGVQITPAVVPLSLPAIAAVTRGVTLTATWMKAMVTGLAEMLVGRQKLALAGPVKISEMSRDVSNQGLEKFLLFMALLSINLGVINLLPIPALDGGRLLFIFAEAVRGRRVEPAREAVVHLVGFVVVIGLMVVLTAVEVTGILQGKP